MRWSPVLFVGMIAAVGCGGRTTHESAAAGGVNAAAARGRGDIGGLDSSHGGTGSTWGGSSSGSGGTSTTGGVSSTGGSCGCPGGWPTTNGDACVRATCVPGECGSNPRVRHVPDLPLYPGSLLGCPGVHLGAGRLRRVPLLRALLSAPGARCARAIAPGPIPRPGEPSAGAPLARSGRSGATADAEGPWRGEAFPWRRTVGA